MYQAGRGKIPLPSHPGPRIQADEANLVAAFWCREAASILSFGIVRTAAFQLALGYSCIPPTSTHVASVEACWLLPFHLRNDAPCRGYVILLPWLFHP